MNTDLIAHAVMVAEQLGAPVFPVLVYPDPKEPGKMKKQPLEKGWQNSGAVIHSEAIERLFNQHPQATHIGLQTGETSRILAIDLDGEPGLDWWRANAELLPPTRTQRTQRSGGKHLLYRMPAGCKLRNSASKIAPGVDIRAGGGFIVDWSAKYPPDSDEIADAPAGLIEFLELAAARAPSSAAHKHSSGVHKIGAGGRHDALKSIAASLRRKGLKGQVLEAALLAWNTEHCEPPQDHTDVTALARDFSLKDGDELTVATDSWPDPVNIFAELAAAPFEASDVPAALGDYPAAYSAQTGIDRSITLVSAVVSAAAAIDDRFQICADSSSNWFAQPRLWAVVIGAPGTGKTPGQREMLAPLRELHRELHEAWCKAVKDWPEDGDEPKPPRPRVVVGDTTLEALSDVLVDNPRGVIVATDEFDAWLGSLDQYRSGGVGRDRGEWLRLFDGGPHSVERVRRSLYVPNWAASLISATTPAAIASTFPTSA